MKTFIYLVITCLSLSIFSCSSSSDSPSPYFFSAKIDSQDFDASSITGVYQDKGYGINGGKGTTTSITISSPSTPIIGGPIPYVTSTGTYQIKGVTAVAALGATDDPIFTSTAIINGQSGYTSTSGSITITELTASTIKGTFNIEFTNILSGDKVSVTNGEFSAPIL